MPFSEGAWPPPPGVPTPAFGPVHGLPETEIGHRHRTGGTLTYFFFSSAFRSSTFFSEAFLSAAALVA